jgi:hypothetical protein
VAEKELPQTIDDKKTGQVQEKIYLMEQPWAEGTGCEQLGHIGHP